MAVQATGRRINEIWLELGAAHLSQRDTPTVPKIE